MKEDLIFIQSMCFPQRRDASHLAHWCVVLCYGFVLVCVYVFCLFVFLG